MAGDKIDRSRLLIPALGGIYELGADYAYSFIRFAAGAVLFPHGVQKVFSIPLAKFSEGIAAKGLPAAELLGALTYFTEFAAAAMLAVGLFTRFAAALIWIEMLIIMTTFIGTNGYFWTNRGIEYALLWFLICTAVLFRGGGRYSIDRLLPREL